MRKQVLLLAMFLPAKLLLAQTCTNPGQTPPSAIRVCGGLAVVQNAVPLCGQTNVPTPCVDAPGNYQNKNPFWYKMACYGSGTLGFIITPNDLTENFDWQLFDITGRNPVDVFTVASIFMGCNWSSDPGETGASIDGTSLTVCSGGGQPLFSQMPDLVAGREYMLMISHNSTTTNGFQLFFAGGSAVIADPLEPQLTSARLNCDGTKIIVKVNRGMMCNTLASDGSDFVVSNGTPITWAYSTGCGFSPTTDSIVLTLANPLPNGNYSLILQAGTDGNTLKDICNREIPAGSQLPFVVAPPQPTLFDSVRAPGCSFNTIRFVFDRPMQCSSIDPSDFSFSGPQPIIISGISMACSGPNPQPLTTFIDLQLASMPASGVYQVTLVTGTDGNTLLDECGMQTPGATLTFTILEPASAGFTYSIRPSCKNDTLSFSHDGANGVNSWSWTFDNTITSNLQNPVQIYPATGQHTIRLIVSNGSCKDTATATIVLNNNVTASFKAPDMICPGDTAHFTNTTTGNVETWLWNFGNGNTSNLQSPPAQNYLAMGGEIYYTVKLVAINSSMNCRDSTVQRVRVLGGCHIAVPSAFTPNNDGVNDYLYPLNALKADQLEFRVYNRMGQQVFFTRDWTRKWDGRINGLLQQTGAYAWTLSFINRDTKQKVFMKGTTLLIR